MQSKLNMTKELKKISIVLYFIAFPLLVWSQDASTPQEAYVCERPQFMAAGDKHRNCRDMYNRKMGLWKTYSYSRVLISEINYENDKKHGMSRRYFPHTGALQESCEYHYGIRDGEFKNFYYNGFPKMEGNYVMGKMDGMWTKYHLGGGEIAVEGSYSMGKKVGIWKFYNTKGELLKTIVYNNEGIVQSINGLPPSEYNNSNSKYNGAQIPGTTKPSPSAPSTSPNGTKPSGDHQTSPPSKGKPKIN